MPPIPGRSYLPTESDPVRIIEDDCLDVLPRLPTGAFDAVVTDPPYGLEFMGKDWDHGVPGVPYWEAVGRVLKPGGYLLAFGGTRTYHRLTCAVEDAGFEIRDCLLWLYGTGFPKGQETNLKPAYEPIILARRHGRKVLPLMVNECRIPCDGGSPSQARRESARRTGNTPGRPGEYRSTIEDRTSPERYMQKRDGESLGRYPANVLYDGSSNVVDMLNNAIGHTRFFYCAKASGNDRGDNNTHPTVKPLALMRWLVRLVCPPGGLVLDPFGGSGTTGVAALTEGRRCLLIEKAPAYAAIARRRVAEAMRTSTDPNH